MRIGVKPGQWGWSFDELNRARCRRPQHVAALLLAGQPGYYRRCRERCGRCKPAA